MTYRIVRHGQPIGTSKLEFRDSAQAIAFGRFFPLPAYAAVRPVFLRFTAAQHESGQAADQQAIADYYAARDSLKLALQTEEGVPVETAYIHIVDWGPGHEDEMEAEVQVLDTGFWSLESV
jgi:hypothetical protein